MARINCENKRCTSQENSRKERGGKTNKSATDSTRAETTTELRASEVRQTLYMRCASMRKMENSIKCNHVEKYLRPRIVFKQRKAATWEHMPARMYVHTSDRRARKQEGGCRGSLLAKGKLGNHYQRKI